MINILLRNWGARLLLIVCLSPTFAMADSKRLSMTLDTTATSFPVDFITQYFAIIDYFRHSSHTRDFYSVVNPRVNLRALRPAALSDSYDEIQITLDNRVISLFLSRETLYLVSFAVGNNMYHISQGIGGYRPSGYNHVNLPIQQSYRSLESISGANITGLQISRQTLVNDVTVLHNYSVGSSAQETANVAKALLRFIIMFSEAIRFADNQIVDEVIGHIGASYSAWVIPSEIEWLIHNWQSLSTYGYQQAYNEQHSLAPVSYQTQQYCINGLVQLAAFLALLTGPKVVHNTDDSVGVLPRPDKSDFLEITIPLANIREQPSLPLTKECKYELFYNMTAFTIMFYNKDGVSIQ